MSITTLKHKIKKNDKLKRIIHFLIMNQRGSCPRLWVKWFINPFMLTYGKRSKIRRSAIMNVSPINPFVLGQESVIEHYATVDNGVGQIHIGDYTRIGIQDTIIGPVFIGNQVILAQNVTISGLNHKYDDISKPILAQGITTSLVVVGDESWIGANAIITAGVHIGKHCVVGAGSVVTKDIPDYSVAVGNPAKVVKRYDPCKQVWIKTSEA